MNREIRAFIHCAKCLEDPELSARIEVGWTPKGLQIWCARHNCNVMALDFRGQKLAYDNGAVVDGDRRAALHLVPRPDGNDDAG